MASRRASPTPTLKLGKQEESLLPMFLEGAALRFPGAKVAGAGSGGGPEVDEITRL